MSERLVCQQCREAGAPLDNAIAMEGKESEHFDLHHRIYYLYSKDEVDEDGFPKLTFAGTMREIEIELARLGREQDNAANRPPV